ncbi:MAG: FkbM family methyltransferase [Rhodospirillales bacterium]
MAVPEREGHNDLWDRADKLLRNGEAASAISEVLKFRDLNRDRPWQALNAGIWLVNNGQVGEETLKIFEEVYEIVTGNAELLATLARVRIMSRHDEAALETAAEEALAALALDRTSQPAFHSYVLARLLQKRYLEAHFATLATERLGVDLAILSTLSDLLSKGVKAIEIKAMGDDYAFMIKTETPACVHACGQFLSHNLFESEELEYTRTFAADAETMLEVGTLLGNHTAFYLRNFALKAITCVEALPSLAEATQWAAEHNRPEGSDCVINVINAWADEAVGEIEVLGHKVRRAPIDDLIDGPVDFIKIDVDGGEMAVLAGAEKTLTDGPVRLMLETADQNETAAHAWLGKRGYQRHEIFRHRGYANHFYRRDS